MQNPHADLLDVFICWCSALEENYVDTINISSIFLLLFLADWM